MDDLKKLPPPEKKVVAKTLYNMGWSARKLEEYLGLSDNTVLRVVDEPTPDELKRFEASFIKTIQAEKQRGVALGIKRLLELLPKERRIEPLVKGLEYLEGKNTNTAVQVNIKQEFNKELEEYK